MNEALLFGVISGTVVVVMLTIIMVYVVMSFDKIGSNDSPSWLDPPSLDRHAGPEVVPPHGIQHLFFISSNDQDQVVVSSNGVRTITVSVPTKRSTFRVFTDIPLHDSYDMGNLSAAHALFNVSSTAPISTAGLSEAQAQVMDEIINVRTLSFIHEHPNCTLSLTRTGDPVSHVNTIARMVDISVKGDNTDLTFIIHPNEGLVEGGVYEHIAITVDSYLDIINIVAIGSGTIIACATIGMTSLGVGAIACAIAIIGTIAELSKIISEREGKGEQDSQLLLPSI